MSKIVSPKRRIISFDVTRTLAIFFVVLCHATEVVYSLSTSTWGNAALPTKILAVVMHTAGRLGVPLFLFLTGALVLKKRMENGDDVLKFYKKNLLPLIIVHVVWVLLYNLYFILSNQSDKATIDAVLKELLFAKNVPLPNMWYMPMIIGIYIALPFLAKIVQSFSGKSITLAAVTIFIVCFVVPYINILFSICGVEEKLFPVIDVSFLGGVYGLYVVLGYLFTNYKGKKIKSIWLILIALLSFVFTCYVQLLAGRNGSHYDYNDIDIWYDFPFLLICGACLFIVINRIKYKKINKRLLNVITFISKASLGIFFVHIIWQSIFANLLAEIISPVKLLLVFLATLFASVMTCYLLSKIKFISKWMLLIKA